MNKATQISFYKKQLETSKQMKAVAEQNYSIAAQLESEAESALTLLGNKSGRTRKGSSLSNELQLQLRASLTK
jgi:hypothetical protein